MSDDPELRVIRPRQGCKILVKSAPKIYHKDTPLQPYITFRVGSRPLRRLIIELWSRDQGSCDQRYEAADPYANSYTWFALGLVPDEDDTDTYEIQRNVRASSITRCHTLVWDLGVPFPGEMYDEVQGLLESVSTSPGARLGVFAMAKYQGWMNLVRQVTVKMYDDSATTEPGDGTRVPLSTGGSSYYMVMNPAPMSQRPPERFAADLALLGSKMGWEYRRTGNLDVLNKGINALTQAVDRMSPKTHTNSLQARALDDLGLFLTWRSQRTTSLEDANRAIEVSERALGLTSGDDAPKNRPHYLHTLGCSHVALFMRTEIKNDLDRSIELMQEALDLCPQDHRGHLDLASCLNDLATGLTLRYDHFGMLEDCVRAAELSTKSVKLTPEDDSSLPSRLSNLANHVRTRGTHTDSEEDFNMAVSIAQKAVALSSPDPIAVLLGISTLGNCYLSRYWARGNLDDLIQATDVTTKTLEATPSDSPTYAKLSASLGKCLDAHFNRTGSMFDLDRAVRFTAQAVDSTAYRQGGFGGLRRNLRDLGWLHFKRFQQQGAIEDLHKALDMTMKAVKASPEHSTSLSDLLCQIADTLGHRSLYSGSMDDINQAVEAASRAVSLAPEISKCLYVHSVWLDRRFQKLQADDDLNMAVEMAEKALEHSSQDSPDLPIYLLGFGNRLAGRFQKTGSEEDFDRILEVCEQAVALTAEPTTLEKRILHLQATLRRITFNVPSWQQTSPGWSSRNSPS